MSLTDSVQAGLDKLAPIDVRDQAVADLALAYAAAIDAALSWSADGDEDGEDRWRDRQRDPLAELGPKLLAALTALQMTPAARKAAVQGDAAPAARTPLDELRAKRAARAE